MKYILLSFFFSTSILAEVITECGEYNVRAVVRAKKDGMVIVVNEKTQSEHTIALPVQEQAKLGAYMEKPASITLLLTSPFNGTRGYSNTIIKIEDRIPNPLNPQDTGFKLIKKLDCKKD